MERPQSLHLSVQEAIKAFILDNHTAPEQPLPSEGELARQLGVSRNSVREAVRALESIGVLETRRGSGLFVRAFSFEPLLSNLQYGLLVESKDVRELLELRRVLEVGLIPQAIQVLTPESILTLHSILDAMKVRAEAGQAFPEEDRAFHQAVFDVLGNRLLRIILDTFWLAFTRAALSAGVLSRSPLATYADHARILEAIEHRDPNAARAALDEHYDDIDSRLRSENPAT